MCRGRSCQALTILLHRRCTGTLVNTLVKQLRYHKEVSRLLMTQIIRLHRGEFPPLILYTLYLIYFIEPPSEEMGG